MGRYVIRRILQFIPTVLGTMFLLHYLTSLAIQFTGNPVRAIFGDRTPPPAQLEQVTRAFGLDDNCLEQRGNPCFALFGRRLENIFLHFDFGTNLRGREVTEMMSTAFPYTLRLTLIAFIFLAVVGLTAGMLAGLRSGSFYDYLVKISTVVLVAMPVFVLGLLVQLLGGVWIGRWLNRSDWAPDFLVGIFQVSYKPEYPWLSLVLPGLALAALDLATVARLTRTSLMENIRADFVRTAKAKGLAQRRVVGVHTLRNSLIPVITYLGVQIGGLMGGAVVTETIFNIPGIGRTVGLAVRNGEPTVVIGIVTVLVLVYLIANLLVDISYAVLDPRIRYD